MSCQVRHRSYARDIEDRGQVQGQIWTQHQTSLAKFEEDAAQDPVLVNSKVAVTWQVRESFQKGLTGKSHTVYIQANFWRPKILSLWINLCALSMFIPEHSV